MSSLPEPSYTEHFLHNNKLIRVQLKHPILILFDQYAINQVALGFSVSFTTQSDCHGNLTGLTIYSKQVIHLAHNNPTVLEQWVALLHQMIHKVGFHQDYTLVKNIGQGSSAKVFIAQSLRDGRQVVAKAFAKKKMEVKEILALQNQINILKIVNCQYFPKFIATYQTQNTYYLVMEYALGITLKKFTEEKRFRNAERKRVLAQIGLALKQLHGLQLVHRDIKPQNIIYNVRTGQIKIVDFGFAFRVSQKVPIYSNCGTPGYAPPESFSKGYKPSFKGDVFSLGVLAHFMFTGGLPYRSSGKNLLIDTRDCRFSLSSCLKKYPSLISLLKKVVCHQSSRIDIDQFLCSPFILEIQESPRNNPQARQLQKDSQHLSTLNKRLQSFYGRQRGFSLKLRQKSKIGEGYNGKYPILITNCY